MLFNTSTIVAVLAGLSAVASAKGAPHGAALCKTSDVQANINSVKDAFNMPKDFCKWFITKDGVRAGSPVNGVNHADFVQACGCLIKQYDANPKKTIKHKAAPKSFSAACRVDAHNDLLAQVNQPQKFCTYLGNQVGFDNSFAFPGGVNAKQLANACECVLHPKKPTKGPQPKTTSKTSTTSSATKTSTTSSESTKTTSTESKTTSTASMTTSSSSTITAAPVTTSKTSTMDGTVAATKTAMGFAKRYHAPGRGAFRG